MSANVRTVRRPMADGTFKEYTYVDKRARKREPVPDQPRRSMAYAYTPETVGELLREYDESPEFEALARVTKLVYRRYMGELGRAFRDVPYAEISPKQIVAMRNAFAKSTGAGAANGFVISVRVLFGWAIRKAHKPLARNPAAVVELLPGGELPAWTDEEAQHAMRELPEPLRRVVVLGYYTSWRRGDLVRLTWSDYDGRSLRVVQQKTRVEVVLDEHSLHPALKAELDAWKRDPVVGTTILLGPGNRPWPPNALSDALPPALRRIGITRKLNVHGLRKLAATRLADAGCTVHEIMSFTGHKTLEMVQHYTKTANQTRLAGSGMTKLLAAETQHGEKWRKN
jgi:integrase